MVECAQLLERKMREAGIDARTIPTGGYPVVFGEVKSKDSERTILVYGHYDVQPPEPLEEWESPPFAAKIQDGKIFGRGASDMKCGVMAVVKGVESCIKTKQGVPVNVKIIFEGEEEISSPHLEEFVKNNKELLKAEARIDYDGPTDVCLGDKGMLYVQLTAKEDRGDIHSKEATVLVSPTWRLIWALNTLKNQSETVTIQGFYEDAKDPNEMDIALIKQLTLDPEELHSGRLLDGLETKEKILRRRLFSPTCNISGIMSGYTGSGAKTVLPRMASAKVDMRLVPDQDPEDIFTKLKRHLEKHGFNDIEVTKIGQLWPSKTPASEKIVKAVIKSAEMAHGRKPKVEPISPASGPTYVFARHLKLPTVSTGAQTTTKRNHAPNEYVEVNDYLAAIKKLAAILYNYRNDDTS